jgi:hypothetical protein
LQQCWRDGFKVHRCLHAGFNAAGDENFFEAAVAELGSVGIQRVVACIEGGEAEGAVLCRGGVGFSARGLVAQDNADAGERRGMEIGEASGE